MGLQAQLISSCHLTTQSDKIGHFTVMYLVAKPLFWSEAEGDLVVLETSILLAW